MKRKAIIDTYAFDDMTIKVIISDHVADVYIDRPNGLLYVFGVMADALADCDIEALHENGYFTRAMKVEDIV